MSDVSDMDMSLATFETSVGGLLLAVVFQAMTYGAATTLVWNYLRRYLRESRWVSAAVIVSWILCTLCLVVTLHAIYYFTITVVSAPSGLTKSPWSLCLLTAAVGLVLVSVRFIFLNRVRRLYQAKGELGPVLVFLLCLTALLSLGDFSGGVAITVKLFSDPSGDSLANVRALFEAMFVLGIFADLFLAGMLCVCLNNSRTGLRRTDSVINLLILYTINTALFPTVIGIVCLIIFFASPHTLLYVAFYVQVANLYLISLLASLDHREVVRRQMTQPLPLNFAAFDGCQCASGAEDSVETRESQDLETGSWLSLPRSFSPQTNTVDQCLHEHKLRDSMILSQSEKGEVGLNTQHTEVDLSDAERYNSETPESEVCLDSVIAL